VNIHSVRSSLAGWLLAAAAGLVVSACGGGGASSNNSGGVPVLSPSGATFYAGVPSTITITGGTRPYKLTSSEPSLFPVPSELNSGSLTVIPANPGVIDAGLQPDELPVRTVNITAIDRLNNSTTIAVKIAQNFLTGYGISFSSNCEAATGAAPPSACAGGESVITLHSTTNGNLHGNRLVRFEVLRGPYQFEQLPNTTALDRTYTTTTDHEGMALAVIRVNNNVTGQLGVIRVVDVATGVYVDHVFGISGAAARTLTAIPDTFTFTGPLAGICGSGNGQFLVFDGLAPYSAISTAAGISVSPSSTGQNPGIFTITVSGGPPCPSGTIVVTDSSGARTTVTVTSAEGSGTPTPPPALTVAPTTITLVCGTAGSVSVVGGTGSYFANSTHPRVTAVVSGNTLTITRLAGDGGVSYPTGGTVSVSDGSSVGTVAVTVPASCP
jgi:hypothetical protein